MGGCISSGHRSNSKLELDYINPNAFPVVNIDDNGTALWSGHLNITRTEMVLYRRGCEPTRWPLKCLRKYGRDEDLLSFEVGRRCATGEGIYAFRCCEAGTIFEMLQSYIQLSAIVHHGTRMGNASSNQSRNDASSPMSILSEQPSHNSMGTYIMPNSRSHMNRASLVSATDPRRSFEVVDSDYLEPITGQSTTRGAFNVTHGFTSNSSLEPMSPSSLNSLNNVSETTASDQLPIWNNTLSDADKESLSPSNKAKKLSLDIPPQEYAPSPNPMLSNYMNGNRLSIEQLPFSPTKPSDHIEDLNQPTYVNVTPGELSASSVATTPKLLSMDFKQNQTIRNNINHNNNYLIDYTHCYENLDLNNMRAVYRGFQRPMSRASITSPGSNMNDLLLESASPNIAKVNYIVLDLDQSQNVATTSSAATTPMKQDSIQSSTPNGSPLKTPNGMRSFTRTMSQSTTMHSISSLLPPESPQKGDFDYATIDFNKTVALSNSITTTTECEGARKTRHSSTIVPNASTPTPHNSVSD